MSSRSFIVDEIVRCADTLAENPVHKRVICLTGEAGIGKSTLLTEVQALLLNEQRKSTVKIVVASAACSAPLAGQDLGSVEALQPWAQLLNSLVQKKENHRYLKLATELAVAWIRFVPFLGDAIWLTADTVKIIKDHSASAKTQQRPEASALNQQQVFQQYINLISRIATESTLVLLLDDVHWADESSLNLLFAAARQLRDKAVLIVVAYRPLDILMNRNGLEHPLLSIRNELDRYDLVTEYPVPGLDDAGLSTIIHQRYGDAYIRKPELEEYLKRACGGNPLFALSLLETLEGEGMVSSVGEVLGMLDDARIPKTIQAVVNERLRQLDQQSRDLLRYGSVEGDQFSVATLTKVAESSPLKLLQSLRHIEQSTGIIRTLGKQERNGIETTVYEFTHSLVRELLYQSLELEEREIVHSILIGEMIGVWRKPETASDVVSALSARLAVHASVVGNHLLAAEAYLRIAEFAWQHFSQSETLAALEQSLNHLKLSMNQNADALIIHGRALELRAEVHLTLYNLESAFADLAKAREYFALAGDVRKEIDCIISLSSVESRRTLVENQRQYASEAYNRSLEAGYEAGLASSLTNLGIVHETLGEFDKAVECYKQAIDYAERSENVVRAAAAYVNLGRVQLLTSQDDLALESTNHGAELFASVNHTPGQARALSNLGIAYRDGGKPEMAIECLHRALALNESIGDLNSTASTLTNIGVCLFDQHNFEEASSYFRRSIALKESDGELMGLGVALIAYASCLDQLGVFDEALLLHLRAKKIFEEMPEAMWTANAEYGLGMHYLHTGDLVQARQWLTSAHDRSTSIHASKSLQMIEDGMRELETLELKQGSTMVVDTTTKE